MLCYPDFYEIGFAPYPKSEHVEYQFCYPIEFNHLGYFLFLSTVPEDLIDLYGVCVPRARSE